MEMCKKNKINIEMNLHTALKLNRPSKKVKSYKYKEIPSLRNLYNESNRESPFVNFFNENNIKDYNITEFVA